MSALPWLRWLHLSAAACWLGGMVTLGVLVGVLRKEGIERPVLRSAAQAFGRVSWAAMGVAVATGVAQVHLLHLSWSYSRLHHKLAVVAVTLLVALIHTGRAKSVGPRARGAMEVALLLLSLLVFAAAVRL